MCHPIMHADAGQLEAQNIRNLEVTHIKTDPRSRTKLHQRLDVSKYKAAIVLCGECSQRSWLDLRVCGTSVAGHPVGQCGCGSPGTAAVRRSPGGLLYCAQFNLLEAWSKQLLGWRCRGEGERKEAGIN